MPVPLEIRITGGASAADRVNAGQTIARGFCGLVTFANPPAAWDGDAWVLRCECEDIAAVSVPAIDGFTVTVGGVTVEPPAVIADEPPPCFTCGPVESFAPPAKKTPKPRNRAVPG